MEDKHADDSLEWLFHPKSIAVVGVSNRKPHLREMFLDSQRHFDSE